MAPLASGRLVKGLLIDITGVLYEAGTTVAIGGSIEALNLLRKSKIPFKFVTNETQDTLVGRVAKLQSFGFNVNKEDIFAPSIATKEYLTRNNLVPHLLVHPKIKDEFKDLSQDHDANCVVIGDAGAEFSYENLNFVFNKLITNKSAKLIAMSYSKYYKDNGKLVIDGGSFVNLLEFATGLKATVIGKPSPFYFKKALEMIKSDAKDSVMIGDDINSDVGAAQAIGMSGILLRTGKFRHEDTNHQTIKPDVIADNFLASIEAIFTHNRLCCESSSKSSAVEKNVAQQFTR